MSWKLAEAGWGGCWLRRLPILRPRALLLRRRLQRTSATSGILLQRLRQHHRREGEAAAGERTTGRHLTTDCTRGMDLEPSAKRLWSSVVLVDRRCRVSPSSQPDQNAAGQTQPRRRPGRRLAGHCHWRMPACDPLEDRAPCPLFGAVAAAQMPTALLNARPVWAHGQHRPCEQQQPGRYQPSCRVRGVCWLAHIRAVGQWQHPRPSSLPKAASETPSAVGT